MPSDDFRFMDRALLLAARGLGLTWPNPMVGAVVVKSGKIVGEGIHRRYGARHAEVVALARAGAKARGATLYINLEPCAHHGKTPPCTEAVIRAGIRRVVAAMQDPNPKVAGKGFKILRRAGIRVDVGRRRREAWALNRVFIKHISTGLPYVVCKAAVSLDGKIACTTGVSKWITSLKARRYAHALRSLSDAIVVGSETIFQDDPELIVRDTPMRRSHAPIRIVLAGRRPLPSRAKIFHNLSRSRTVLAHADNLRWPKTISQNVEKWPLPADRRGRLDVESLLRRLGKEGACFILVEGGSEVHASFLGLNAGHKRVWADEIQFIIAPKILGGKRAPGAVGGPGVSAPDLGLIVRDMEIHPMGEDFLIQGKPVAP